MNDTFLVPIPILKRSDTILCRDTDLFEIVLKNLPKIPGKAKSRQSAALERRPIVVKGIFELKANKSKTSFKGYTVLDSNGKFSR